MNAELLSDSASASSFQKNVYRAWESFMTTGECNRGFIRGFIYSSWQRCSERGTPHRLARQMPIVSQDFLKKAHLRSGEFSLAAKEVLKPLLSAVDTPRTVVLVADAEGVILDTYGTRRNVDFAADINLRSGGNCHELAGGTNAIGTALAIGRAAQVHAEEHFYQVVKGWTCAAALVRDPVDSKILGVLDISGTRDTFNSRNLALAISIAGQIEALLRENATQTRLQLLEWCQNEASAWRSDALILLDSEGRVVCRNKNVANAMSRVGLDPSDIAAWQSNIGAEAKAALPSWIRREWVHPAIVNNRCIGNLVVIPNVARDAEKTISRCEQTCNSSNANAFQRVVGSSVSLRAAIDKARRLAQSDCPILLLGETGVGKEEFAIAIHEASTVRDGPFVAINAGALPKDLAASELFGYADGAFTGGRRGGRAGKFEEADGGTLFLDEVGELAPEIQVQLLRVLQDGELSRIGENRKRRVDVRLISATHVNLRAAIEQGAFRKDLFYRLSVTSVNIAPLREWREDIPALVAHFLKQFATRHGVVAKCINVELLRALENLPWPGNVRELRNLLEQMCLLSDYRELAVSDLPCEYACAYADGKSLSALEQAERDRIAQALARDPSNLTRVARELGIARSTLYVKLKKYVLVGVTGDANGGYQSEL